MIASPRPQARRRMSLALTAAGAAALLASAFAGCSQPAPRIPEGAWYLRFDDAGLMCDPGPHEADIGEVSSANRTTLVEDDETFEELVVTVYCSVVDKEGTFSLNAGASTPNGTGLTLIVNELSPTATKDNPSIGSVSYRHAVETAGVPYSSSMCNFYFADGTGQGVQPGTVWVSFDCPTVSSAPNDCTIPDGVAAFEQCETVSD
jgi:hypothetical protein